MSVLGAVRKLVLRRPVGDVPIALIDPKDIAFAKIAQGAKVRQTTFPSGYKSPDVDMVIRGTWLVPQ